MARAPSVSDSLMSRKSKAPKQPPGKQGPHDPEPPRNNKPTPGRRPMDDTEPVHPDAQLPGNGAVGGSRNPRGGTNLPGTPGNPAPPRVDDGTPLGKRSATGTPRPPLGKPGPHDPEPQGGPVPKRPDPRMPDPDAPDWVYDDYDEGPNIDHHGNPGDRIPLNSRKIPARGKPRKLPKTGLATYGSQVK